MDELEKLRKENEQLKQTVQYLRQQLDSYKKYSRRQYEIDQDYVPYHERED